MILALPCHAYADDSFEGSDGGGFGYEVVYGPTIVNLQQQKYGIIVWCDNKYDSALLALGYDIYADSRLTADVKAYLSNESTGGSFYEFANDFSDSIPEQGSTIYSINFGSTIRTTNTIYGRGYVWWSTYTETLYNGAKQRVEDVIAGNVSGGSGGGSGESSGGTGVQMTFEGTPNIYVSSANRYFFADGADSSSTKIYNNYGASKLSNPFTVTCYVPANIVGQYPMADYDYILLCRTDDTYSRRGSVSLSLLVATKNGYTVQTENSSGYTWYQSITANATCYLFSGINSNNAFAYTCTYSDMVVSESALNVNPTINTYGNGNVIYAGNGPGYLPYKSGGGTTAPPTNWPEPDPPITTEPPEVPEPEPPSGSNQTDISIQFPNITFPSITLSPDFTWVTADIDAILRSLNSHCQHLQEAIHNGFEDFYEDWEIVVNRNFGRVIQAIQTNFGWIWDNVQDEFDYLYDYLYDLFHWLARQFDFSGSSGYSDDTVVSWLKKIYQKLGNGPVNTRPVDPVADPIGLGEWFSQLINNFIAALLGIGQDILGDIGDMLSDLITKFPFSIPWDIAAILALFAAEPVTPVLTIPQYALTGGGVSQVGQYVIDLEPYDGVMEVVRNVEKIVFAFWLCWKIDFFKQIFDITTGGNK